MPEAVLIITFSPIQPFIIEARRTADLFTGSRILVALSKSVKSTLQTHHAQLVYPVSKTTDLPNKLVAVVPWNQAKGIALDARKEMLVTWQQIAESARTYLSRFKPNPDPTWNQIFERQVGSPDDDPHPYWEYHWAAALIQEGDYAKAYLEAEQTLNSAKRCRSFAQISEPGIKDSLSGRREALQTKSQDARFYWRNLHAKLSNPSQLRSGERLDAFGAVKRFSSFSVGKTFPSTSTIAARPFLTAVCASPSASSSLRQYREKLENLLKGAPVRIADHPDWPYDGDFLYPETLLPKNLLEAFPEITLDPQKLKAAQAALEEIHGSPSSYYAILALDGDSMGAHITAQLEKADPLASHQEFSRNLSHFAGQVPAAIQRHQAELVYNGGDDVFALAPLSTCMDLYFDLATLFNQTTNGTASCGIAIAHRNFPLGAAIKAARQAESRAKAVENKDAVCVHVIKRSGESIEVRSRRAVIADNFSAYQGLISGPSPQLSNRFAYDLLQSTYALPEANGMLTSETRRLLQRHKVEHAALDCGAWAEKLRGWAEALPGGPEELARWLLLARFIVSGGGDL